MTTGERIRAARLEKGLTQKELGARAKIAEPTIRRYELGKLNPKFETLARIAEALNVDPFSIMDFDMATEAINSNLWTEDLEIKLKQISCSLEFNNDGSSWIVFPDGKLEIPSAELIELNSSTNSYMKFKLEELKQKHIADFRPNK